MVKIFVLDTNILIHDPNAIFSFSDNDVIVPIYVIEEIDKLKRELNGKGRSARVVARNIDELRKKGKLSQWCDLDTGGRFKVAIEDDLTGLPSSLKKDIVDNRIIGVAQYIKDSSENKNVILVSKDVNMRIKANSIGLQVEDYETDTIDISELYSGEIEQLVPDKLIDKFYSDRHISINEIEKQDFYPNEMITLKSNENEKKQAITVYKKSRRRMQSLTFGESTVWGISGKNREQKYALELLMDKDIKVVTLVGQAGTGKTLLALATGLEQVVEKREYKKLLVARPIVPMGKDIGYLPGGEKEKLRPWIQPIYDNFDFLTDKKGEDDGEKIITSLESMGYLKIEALTYIRGRTIPAGFIIIDEAQNLTPHEIKTIVTRAGDNTKVVFTGDPYQIDNPYLDANSNGLTYLAEKFKNEEIAGHITLIKGERSELAEIAARLL